MLVVTVMVVAGVMGYRVVQNYARHRNKHVKVSTQDRESPESIRDRALIDGLRDLESMRDLSEREKRLLADASDRQKK